MKKDRDYEEAINKLIPLAETAATKRLVEHGQHFESRLGANGHYYNHCFWTQFFHEEMARLAKQAGLRK